VPGLQKYFGTNTHLCDALASEAVAAIDGAVAEQQPFFLYMAPYAVHTPIQPHPRFIENYRGKKYPGTDIDIPENEARYASMVEGFDAALGTIIDRITELNIADRTIILFTSDNGGLSVHTRDTTPYGTGADTHNRPLREGKGSAYDGGTRVPMIISWATPDSGSSLQKQVPLRGGSVCDAPVISEDLMPTICRWAGVDPVPNDEQESPPEKNHSLDGIDLTPALTSAHVNAERPLLFHYPHVWGPSGHGYQPHSSLIDGEWKIVYFYDSESWELYDLAADVGETRDLASQQTVRRNEMAQALIRELVAREAQYPTLRETGQPAVPVMPPDRSAISDPDR
jgi:arylsulfatase A-like enzyme